MIWLVLAILEGAPLVLVTKVPALPVALLVLMDRQLLFICDGDSANIYGTNRSHINTAAGAGINGAGGVGIRGTIRMFGSKLRTLRGGAVSGFPLSQ